MRNKNTTSSISPYPEISALPAVPAHGAARSRARSNGASAIQSNQPSVQAYGELVIAYDWFNQSLFGGELPTCLITLQRHKKTMGYFSRNRFVGHDGQKTDEIALNPEYFAVVPVQEVLSTLVHEMVHLWQEHFDKPGRGRYHNQKWADKMKDVGLQPSDTGIPGGRETGDHMGDYVLAGGRFDVACKNLLATQFRISWYDRFPAVLNYPAPTTQVMAGNPPAGGSMGAEEVVGGDEDLENLEAMAMAIPALANPKLDLASRFKQNTASTTTGISSAANTSNKVKYQCAGCAIQTWGKPALHLVCGECQMRLVVAKQPDQQAKRFKFHSKE